MKREEEEKIGIQIMDVFDKEKVSVAEGILILCDLIVVLNAQSDDPEGTASVICKLIKEKTVDASMILKEFVSEKFGINLN